MAAIKPLREKKCKVCGEKFRPFQSTQRTCSTICAINDGRAQRKKADKRELRQAKERIKPRAQWIKEAQAAFNKFIRLRDAAEPCISCGRHHQGQYHAGHYKSTGASPELRFEELNCHKQCAPCNNHLSGNIVNYRPALIAKIGMGYVEWLEGNHPPAKWTIDELKEIKRRYNAKAREIEKAVIS